MLKARLEICDIILKYKLALEAKIGSKTFIPPYTLNGKVQIGDKEYRATYRSISRGFTDYILTCYPNIKKDIKNFKVIYSNDKKTLDKKIIETNKCYIKMPEDYFNE